ncbi:hypothetical protein JZ751_012354 [Albula glossodonta]|uniref:Uncharacterized protein n=1 Tax=Albula glossodonta TaxID=121402 RepID=A0A8T2PSA7_9TELE|nr:hypothetical protein JZ751_012354 [Albula glossodonta]
MNSRGVSAGKSQTQSKSSITLPFDLSSSFLRLADVISCTKMKITCLINASDVSRLVSPSSPNTVTSQLMQLLHRKCCFFGNVSVALFNMWNVSMKQSSQRVMELSVFPEVSAEGYQRVSGLHYMSSFSDAEDCCDDVTPTSSSSTDCFETGE